MTDEDDGQQATINMQDSETYRAQIAEREAELEQERASEAQDTATRYAEYDRMNREWEANHPAPEKSPWVTRDENLAKIDDEEMHESPFYLAGGRSATGPSQQSIEEQNARRKMYDEYDVPHKQSFSAGTKPAKLKISGAASDSSVYGASLSNEEIFQTLKPIGVSKGKGKGAGTLSINPSADIGSSWGALPENSPKPISTLFGTPGQYKTSLSKGEDSGSYAYASMPFSGPEETGGLDIGYTGFNPFKQHTREEASEYRKQIKEGRKEVAPAWSAWGKEEKPKRSMLGGTLLSPTPSGVGKESFGFGGGVDIPWWGSEKSPEQKRIDKQTKEAAQRFDANKSEIDRLANAAVDKENARKKNVEDIRFGKKKNNPHDSYLPGNPKQENPFAGRVSKTNLGLGADKFRNFVGDAPLTSAEKKKVKKDTAKVAEAVIEGWTPELDRLLAKQQEDERRGTKAGKTIYPKVKKEPSRDEYNRTEKDRKADMEAMYKSPFYLAGGKAGTEGLVKRRAASRERARIKEENDLRGTGFSSMLERDDATERMKLSPFYNWGGRSATSDVVRSRHEQRAKNPYGMTEDDTEFSKVGMRKSLFYIGGGTSATPEVVAKRKYERAQDPYGRTNYEIEVDNKTRANSPFYAGGGVSATSEVMLKREYERSEDPYRRTHHEIEADKKNRANSPFFSKYGVEGVGTSEQVNKLQLADLKSVLSTGAFEAVLNEEDKKLRDKHNSESPIGKLLWEKYVTHKKDPHLPQYKKPEDEPTTPWGQVRKRIKTQTRAEIRRPFDELVRGRNDRRDRLHTTGFWYGGGIQPVGVTPQTPMGRFPKTPGSQSRVPNPMAHSELSFWGRPLGLPHPLKGRTKGARRKERAAIRRKDSRKKPTGFFDVMFR